MNPLLQAILADPDDDDARRVYADSLIANSDPRGEFIALQCETAKLDEEIQDLQTKPVWDRVRELREQHAPSWERPLRALGTNTRWWWHRGFVRAIAMRASRDTTEQLAAVLAVEPVIDLAIGGDDDAVAEHLALPGIERVRRLLVLVEDINVVAGAKRLTEVRELRTRLVYNRDIEPLLKPKALARVTHLALGSGCRARDFAKLAKSKLGKRLETFEYLNSQLTREHVEIVIDMPKLRVFAYSFGDAEATALLAARFRDRRSDRVVVCDPRASLTLGVQGISYRALPSP